MVDRTRLNLLYRDISSSSHGKKVLACVTEHAVHKLNSVVRILPRDAMLARY